MALFGEYAQDIVDDYEDVRNDASENIWCAYRYEGKVLERCGSGADYSDCIELMGEDQRVYAYVRFETGDEMSRRAKFAFITWIGPSVPPLKKAKVSTDKAFVKQKWPQFSKEILADEKGEVKHEKLASILEKASGAAYGTGK